MPRWWNMRGMTAIGILILGTIVVFAFTTYLARKQKKADPYSRENLLALQQAQHDAKMREHDQWMLDQRTRRERERLADTQKRVELIAKHGEELGEKLYRKQLWVGESVEMVIESLGFPEDIDEKVMKTKKREIYKYDHRGGNRYGLRVTIEDGVVTGWDEKE